MGGLWHLPEARIWYWKRKIAVMVSQINSIKKTERKKIKESKIWAVQYTITVHQFHLCSSLLKCAIPKISHTGFNETPSCTAHLPERHPKSCPVIILCAIYKLWAVCFLLGQMKTGLFLVLYCKYHLHGFYCPGVR